VKIITVIGARPQFIKAAVVSREFKKHKGRIKEVIVHTGQHFDKTMSDVFFDELNIPTPDYNLGVGGGTHGQNTGRMIEKIEEVLFEERPDWLLVYGDTDSTLAGALAAVKLHIPVAHVEAGLRSFNRKMPEEINRILTDHISSLHFVPSESSKENLLKEGASLNSIIVSGDVMYDAVLFYKEKATKPDALNISSINENNYILSTIHRAENTDNAERMKSIFKGLNSSCLPVVLPLHPRTQKVIHALGIEISKNLHIIEPVGYLEMVWLQEHCQLIVTDSGGMQKEAFFHKKQCLTVRDETEWVELIGMGCNKLIKANSKAINTAILSNIETQVNFPFDSDIYGYGNAAQEIVASLLKAYR